MLNLWTRVPWSVLYIEEWKLMNYLENFTEKYGWGKLFLFLLRIYLPRYKEVDPTSGALFCV